jgi:hypothetical protein
MQIFVLVYFNWLKKWGPEFSEIQKYSWLEFLIQLKINVIIRTINTSE